jgi:hypothetical protein
MRLADERDGGDRGDRPHLSAPNNTLGSPLNHVFLGHLRRVTAFQTSDLSILVRNVMAAVRISGLSILIRVRSPVDNKEAYVHLRLVAAPTANRIWSAALHF